MLPIRTPLLHLLPFKLSSTCAALLQGGATLDVWLQLLQRCAAEPSCRDTALATLAQQLAEQRALTARQQHQIAGLQQQVSDQQQQIAGMREQLEDLLPPPQR
jgi:septal ring factor EnvC (AmiA/AmiB activator)